MLLLRDYSRRKKVEFFLKEIPKSACILEVGCGDSWVGDYMKKKGWVGYIGLDIVPPADFIGDISNWKQLGLKKNSFDVIVAFEVVEHVPCFNECYDLLKPGGALLITTPVPHMDWLCKILETVGMNQQRTSPHNHLIYFRNIPRFEPIETKIVGMIGQWGKFRKPAQSLL